MVLVKGAWEGSYCNKGSWMIRGKAVISFTEAREFIVHFVVAHHRLLVAVGAQNLVAVPAGPPPGTRSISGPLPGGDRSSGLRVSESRNLRGSCREEFLVSDFFLLLRFSMLVFSERG